LKKTRGAFAKKVKDLIQKDVIQRHAKSEKDPRAYYTLHERFFSEYKESKDETETEIGIQQSFLDNL